MEVITKPWGTYAVILNDSTYKVKQLIIESGKRISLQTHEFRNEHWIVVGGEGILTLEENGVETTRTIVVGNYCFIRKGAKHRVQATGNSYPLVLIEVQQGEKCDEEDIVRISDDYNRIR